MEDGTRGGIVARAALVVLLGWWTLTFATSSVASNAAGLSFLHLVNLPFHEAGHILFAPFGRFLAILGGSLLQVVIPLVCAWTLRRRTEDPFGAAVCAWWAGENLVDLAPYIADARALQLILIGGHTGAEVEGHDWEALLTTLGWMRYDVALGKASHALGIVVMVAALAWAGTWLVARWRATADCGRAVQVPIQRR